MPAKADLTRTGLTRMFVIENRAGPANAPTYQGLWKAGAFAWSQGDVTLTRMPDPDRYDRFITVDKVPGDQGPPELTVQALYPRDLSDLLAIVRKGCDVDLRVHIGECQNPRDGNAGWDKILIIEAARATNYSIDNLGALQPSERAQVMEEVPFSGEDAYEVKKITFAQQASAQVAREVLGITVCDSVQCGVCGITSDGCSIVFAITKSGDSSPGLVAELVYTENAGATWDDVDITSLGITEDPSDVLCVGSNVVVLSQESASLHYASTTDILDNSVSATWTEVNTGFVVAGAPRSGISLSPQHTWIVGAAGYIYFTADPTNGVTVQDAGVATAQQLNDIHGVDINSLIAVGNSNAVVVTTNGGATWQSITGPAVGVNLNTVWMVSDLTWWVGSAGGRLYYTNDAGTTWTEKTFSGSGAGVVRDIVFSTNLVGYMAHSTATPSGRIFRTIDGGYSWYTLPEAGGGTLVANDYIAELATCVDPNVVYGGGLGDDALDGVIVKGA